MRLADQIARDGLTLPRGKYGEDLATAIATSRLIVADNVAEYLYQSDRENFDIGESFPLLAPPFKDMFIEWALPSEWNSGGKRVSSARAGVKMGAFVHASEIPSADGEAAVAEADAAGATGFGPGDISKVRWSLVITAIQTGPHGIATYPWLMEVLVDGSGEVCRWFPIGGSRIFSDEHLAAFSRTRANVADGYGPEAFVALLTISFMNCANVSTTTVNPDGKLQRATISRGRPPLRSYYVLQIEPIKSALRSAAGESTPLSKALSICRGHFKDYRKSGLFGRIKGIYWWDSHARGSADNGVILKDYNVKAGV